nr:atherin-like [Aegilops tauschii subsp. strangulata]
MRPSNEEGLGLCDITGGNQISPEPLSRAAGRKPSRRPPAPPPRLSPSPPPPEGATGRSPAGVGGGGVPLPPPLGPCGARHMGQPRCAALAQGGAAAPRAAARRAQRVDGTAAAAWSWWRGVLAWGWRGSSGCFVRSGGQRRGLRRRGLGAAAGLAGPAPGVVELLIHGVAALGGSRGMVPVGSRGIWRWGSFQRRGLGSAGAAGGRRCRA